MIIACDASAATPNAQRTDNNPRGTESWPLAVKLVDTPVVIRTSSAPRSEQPTAEAKDKKLPEATLYWDLPVDSWTAAFTGGLFVVGLITAPFLVWQVILLAKQVRLARQEFIATHRPQLRLGRFYLRKPLAPGEEPTMIFVAQNIGHSAANVTEVRSASIVLGIEDRFPRNMGISSPEPFTTKLQSGQSEVFATNGNGPLNDGDHEAVQEGKRILYFVGVVAYLDDVGNRREVGFCRRYSVWTQQFDSWPTEFEYEF
jgi:hypothetical protein